MSEGDDVLDEDKPKWYWMPMFALAMCWNWLRERVKRRGIRDYEKARKKDE
jgi:hypothetical protein